MQYRPLGRTGVKVSGLCLGCMNFGDPTDEPEAMGIMNSAVEAGINFFDTANVYNRGRSEEIVGAFLKQYGKRDRIVLATKVHGRMDSEDPNAQGNSRKHILQQCEASLRRLQTDYIDLYQMHRPDSTMAIDETLRALDDLIRSGKVRYAGTSTFAAWQILEALWTSSDLCLHRFVCEQPPYNLLDRRIERELIPMALTYGIALIPWSPLAGGFLTGKYKRDGPRPQGSRYEKPGQTWGERCFREEAFDVVEGLEDVAKTKGRSLSQLTLAWCAAQVGITSPIIGPRTEEQLADNLKALDVTFEDSELDRIDEISLPGEVVVPFYEADFGPGKFR